MTYYLHGPHADSLILNLDAKNLHSYPGEGNEWYDISGNGHRAVGHDGAELRDDTRFPEWTAKWGGAFNFDGYYRIFVDSHIPSPNELTMEVWMYREHTGTTTKYISDARNGDGTWHLTNYQGYNINFRNRLQANDPAGHDYRETDSTADDHSNWWEQWHQFVMMSDGSMSKLYVDGERIDDDRLQNNDAFSTGIGDNLTIGNRYTGSGRIDAYISSYRLYGKELSATQVKQNYEAEKWYFQQPVN